MSIAVAHQQVSQTRALALKEAAHEARRRNTNLAVLHVVESLDNDIADAYRRGISGEVEDLLERESLQDLKWDLYLSTGVQDVAETVLEQTTKVGAEVLVIGARRRSPVGKFILGSVTQTIILEADVPVIVVKIGPPAESR